MALLFTHAQAFQAANDFFSWREIKVLLENIPGFFSI